MLHTLTLDMFARHLGGSFRLRPEADRVIHVELIEATPLSTATSAGETARGRREPFSLVFRARGGELVPQRIYRVEHDTLGTHDIFLVPIGPDGGGMRYEAIFT